MWAWLAFVPFGLIVWGVRSALKSGDRVSGPLEEIKRGENGSPRWKIVQIGEHRAELWAMPYAFGNRDPVLVLTFAQMLGGCPRTLLARGRLATERTFRAGLLELGIET